MPAPWKGFVRRDAAGAGDAQDLPDERVLVARGVVLPGATAARVVAAAVADAHVEEAVVAEAEVAGVVVAARRRDLVDEHELGRRCAIVAAAHREARDAVDAACRSWSACSRGRRNRSRRTRGRPRRRAAPSRLRCRATPARSSAGVGGSVPVLDDPQRAELGRDEQPAVRGERQSRRALDVRDERVGEPVRERTDGSRGRAGEEDCSREGCQDREGRAGGVGNGVGYLPQVRTGNVGRVYDLRRLSDAVTGPAAPAPARRPPSRPAARPRASPPPPARDRRARAATARRGPGRGRT